MAGQGELFEEWLELTHRQFLDQGIAWIEKQHVQCRPVFQRDHLIWVPVNKALPDYGGWMANGQGVLFEAKATKNKESWHYPRDRRHQHDYIMRAVQFGVISFYLIYWYEMDEVRVHMARSLPPIGESIKRVEGLLVDTRGGIVRWPGVVEW